MKSLVTTRKCETLQDLSDGLALFEIMTRVYVQAIMFANFDAIVTCSDPRLFDISTLKADCGTNWVLKASNLKRLHRLVIVYYEDVLQQDTSELAVPDLQAASKQSDAKSLCALAELIVGCAVQCDNNKEYIQRITTLDETAQSNLKQIIEKLIVYARIHTKKDSARSKSIDSLDESLKEEFNSLFTERKALESLNAKLRVENEDLKSARVRVH